MCLLDNGEGCIEAVGNWVESARWTFGASGHGGKCCAALSPFLAEAVASNPCSNSVLLCFSARLEYKLSKNIKIAMLYLEDDDAVSAETYIKKASSLLTSCKVKERVSVCCGGGECGCDFCRHLHQDGIQPADLLQGK